jgi:membrane-associated protease RseP (regulator of RpoE activity)
MDTLTYTLGVVVFFLGLMASIALHEVGHMWPAKRFDVKVTEYFVGFGRRVWSFRRGETEYGIKAIPLGGYVKLVGMLPPARNAPPGTGDADHPHRVRTSNTGMFTQLVADARAAEYELVQPGDEDRLFYRKPWWQKLTIMVGGPTANIVIAFFLFSVLIIGMGVPTPTTTIDEVSDCVIAADAAGRPCTSEDPVTPAVRAGLRPGDEITSFNGEQVTSWDQLTGLIRDNADGRAVIGIERDGQPMTLRTDTTVSPRHDLDNPGEYVDVGFLGVSPRRVTVHGTPVDVATEMGSLVKLTGEAMVHLPEKMVGVAKAAFGAERDDYGPVSVVGASRVAGEIARSDATSWQDRIAGVIALLAGVNLFIALFNFIPLLPLDGGHIAGALYEAARRGVARLRGRPDPGYVDVARLLPVAYAVAMVLVVMGVLLVYADLVNPIELQ